jgi:hypothetical protein
MPQARLVPTFRLPAPDGALHGTADLLRWRDMVLAVVHPPGCDECAALLGALAQADPEVRARAAGTLAVTLGPARRDGQAHPPTPFPLVGDEGGKVTAALGAAGGPPEGEARLVVADRYGEVYAVLPAHGPDPGGLARDALAWLDFVQMQCPECGVPEW